MANTPAHGKLLLAAHRALTAQQYQQAHKLAMQVLQANPQEAEAYFIMALITRQHDNIAKAEDIIRRALKFDGENVNYLLFQAQCLLELNQTDAAKAILAGLSSERIASAHQNDTVGVLHSRLGQHAAALDYFRRACELKPDHVNYLYNLAACLQFSGLFEEAGIFYERTIALAPAHYRSHFAVSQLKKQSPDSNHIARLQSLWTGTGDDADARLHIGHALAKEYEDLEDYEQAMQQLLAGKELKLEQLQPQQQDNKALFSALGRASTRLAGMPVTGCDSPEPIFIVGMPRTGTTLVERILSSHSQVVSAGELANFSTLVKQQLGTASRWVLDVETIEQADKLDFEKLGRDYLESTRHLTGNSAHFIDKMPLNFIYIPLIAKALPRAKIICLRRNPMDTVLSNFRQLFATSFTYYNYAYSLKDSAEFYVAFDALIAQCEQDLGTRLYSIAYESVVADAEAQTRQLLQYCELPWEPQCLAFQENTAPVATASAVQVREKLYQRAVHRWKHYEPWLGEVKDIFNANHIVFE